MHLTHIQQCTSLELKSCSKPVQYGIWDIVGFVNLVYLNHDRKSSVNRPLVVSVFPTAGPRGPTPPAGPVGPGLPGAPFSPGTPTEPLSPGPPPFPLAPSSPGVPSLPGGPFGPCGPAAPGGPGCPGAPRSPGRPCCPWPKKIQWKHHNLEMLSAFYWPFMSGIRSPVDFITMWCGA